MSIEEHELPSRRSTPPPVRPRRKVGPRLRSRFTRERVIEFLRAMIWVAPLTIVIWIYAEREQIGPPMPVSDVPVRVFSSDANWSVKMVGAGLVQLDLSGHLDSLQKVQSTLTSLSVPQGLQVDLGSNLHVGEGQQINVAKSIQNQPLFSSNGVTVDAVSPAVVVDIDRMEERTAEVQLPPGLQNVDSATVTFDPRTVNVRGPTQLFNQLGGQPTVYADLTRIVDRLKPGAQKLDQVPVILAPSTPEADRITVMPPANKVSVQITVLAADETRRIPSMPVLVEAPPRLLQNYDVHLDPDAVANVDVSGPPDILNQLDTNPPHAVLDIGIDDVGHDGVKGLRYILPDGVHVGPASTGITVKFSLTARGG